MAKFRLNANADVDILSGPEHKADMAALEASLLDYLDDADGDTQRFTARYTFTTDASGNGSGTAYEVPQGYRCFLSRLAVDYPGSNAHTPVGCDVRITSDQNTPFSLQALNNEVPSVYEASKSHAALFQPGQHVKVYITGGPATTAMYVSGQVILVPVRRRVRSDIQAPPAETVHGSAVGAQTSPGES